MKLTFLGAAGTVTGSKYLLEAEGERILVDCGLYQGVKQLRLRNWQPLPVTPESIGAVLLTHAHIDHSGLFPALVRDGFEGLAFCTPPTRDLCGILLPDCGRLHEEDAGYANRKGFSKHTLLFHSPPRPTPSLRSATSPPCPSTAGTRPAPSDSAFGPRVTFSARLRSRSNTADVACSPGLRTAVGSC